MSIVPPNAFQTATPITAGMAVNGLLSQSLGVTPNSLSAKLTSPTCGWKSHIQAMPIAMVDVRTGR